MTTAFDNPAAARAVFRTKEIDAAREEVARWTAERNHASSRLETAKLRLFLAERASRTGEAQMPLCAEAAKRFFESR